MMKVRYVIQKYPNCFHVIWSSHLFYDLPIKVKTFFMDSDYFILSMKALTLKKIKVENIHSNILNIQLYQRLLYGKLVRCCWIFFQNFPLNKINY